MAIYKDLVSKVSVLPEKKVKQKDYLNSGSLAVVDQGQNLIGGYTNDSTKVVECDLPVIVFGDHTRAVKYVTFPFVAGADGIKVLQPKDGVLPKFLYYSTQYLVLKLEDRGYARHYQYLEKKELDIPSITEQERIILKIEELFSELDKGVETLRNTKAQLSVYRQALIKEAFSKCNHQVEVCSVCEHITDGDHMPPPKSSSGIPFIMISNIENNKINWDNTAYVDRQYYDKIDIKRRPQYGDVLYTVTGSFGIPVLVDFNKEFCFQRHIALLRPKGTILQKFLYYALQTPIVYTQAVEKATGTAQKTVGLGVLRKLLIPYTDSIEIQNEIVNAIDSSIYVCDNIERTIDTALQQAEAIRQSVLKQAFEGRL